MKFLRECRSDVDNIYDKRYVSVFLKLNKTLTNLSLYNMYMRPNLNTLQQHISALCMFLALMFVPKLAQAADYYLVGGFNNWTPSDTYKFSFSGTTATLSLTGAQINATSTQFLIKAVESPTHSWYLKNNSFTQVTVGGDPVVASSYYSEYQNCNPKIRR